MPVYIPDVQRGIAVMGGAGSGKTFSVIDPLIRSSIDQGFPTIVYDFKYPAQTKRIVAYAKARGYDVSVFAPGYPESCTCNLIDLLKSCEDAITAGQLIEVIGKNTDRSKGKGGGDKFFDDAGLTLTEGILLATRAVEELAKGYNDINNPRQYCDLMMASAILSLPNLPQRLEIAANTILNVWTAQPFSQLISVKDAEKTSSGIVVTAQRMFQKFLKKDFIGAFCGETSLPLDLDGKKLVIFGLDRNNRDIVGPLLAAVLHTIVSRNVSRVVPRTDPLVVAIDELPTLYLPYLDKWFNENREDGFCGIIGLQNLAQIERIYGKELARAIVGGCATKFIFNPQDTESGKVFAELLGETEVTYKTKSTSRSTGGKGSTSRSKNQNVQKKHLFEPAQFNRLPTGKAVIVNPAMSDGKESYIPILHKFKIPKWDIEAQNASEAEWPEIREALIKHNVESMPKDITKQMEDRKALALRIFSSPEENAQPGGGGGSSATSPNNNLGGNDAGAVSPNNSDSLQKANNVVASNVSATSTPLTQSTQERMDLPPTNDRPLSPEEIAKYF